MLDLNESKYKIDNNLEKAMGPMLDYIVEELDVQAYEDSISEERRIYWKSLYSVWVP